MEETAHNETGALAGQGESEAVATAQGTTSEGEEAQGTGQAPEKAPVDYEKQYNEIHPEFTRKSQALAEAEKTLSQFDNFGGTEKLLETANFLQNDPGFQEYLQNRQTQEQHQRYGVDTEDLDSESKQAMDLVEKMATEIASQQIEKFKDEFQGKLEPIEAERAEQNLANIESQMDEAHPDWREFKDQMLELSGNLPDNIAESPDFNLVTSLYYQALASNPEKYSEVMAKAHSNKLEKAKSKSIDSPGGTYKGTAGQANSIMEAFKMTQG